MKRWGARMLDRWFGCAVVCAWTLGAAACEQSAPPPPPRPPASVTRATGDSQAVVVGQAVPVAPSVVVKDSSGGVLQGIAVTFRVNGGVGTVTGSPATTTAAGVATVGGWTINAPGDNFLVAEVSGVEEGVGFLAIGGAAAAAMTAPDGLTLAAPTSQQLNLSALVTNASNQPVQNAAVKFTRVSGTGTLAASYVLTNASGIAIGRYIPAAVAGQHSISAALVGGTGASGELSYAVATYSGLTLAAVSATSFVASQGETKSIVVRVRDGSQQPVPNANVKFQAANGSFSGSAATTVKTSAAGEASVSWTLPNAPGTHTMGAEAFGQIVSFSATIHDPPYVLAFGTHFQNAPAGEFAIFNLEARGISNGLIDDGRAITYTVHNPGATLRNVPAANADYTYGSQITVISNRQSDARAQIRLAPGAGVNRITVSSPGYAPDSFHVTATRLVDCSGIASLAPTDSINATLSSADCPDFYRGNNARWYTKPYSMTLGSTTFLRLSLNFATSGTGSDIIVMNQNHFLARRISGSIAGVRLLAAPGTIYLGASTNTVARTGAFSLASYIVAPSPFRPGDYVMRGVDANMTIDALQTESAPPYQGHGAKIYLKAGEPVTVEVQSTAFDPYVQIRDTERTNSTTSSTFVLASDDNGGGGTTARLVWTPPRSGLFEIWLGKAKSTDTSGSYRIIVQ